MVEKSEIVLKKVLLLGETHCPFPGSLEIVQASSIVSCLSRAVEGPFDLFVLCLFTPVHRERNALLELCAVLRANRYTRETLLIAVIPGKHRQLLDRLQRAGVEYVMIAEPEGDVLQRLAALTLPLPGDYRMESLLSKICPYINYQPINSCREITMCGAYRNRLVLGPYRLENFCEVPAHLTCEYYKNPVREEPSPSMGKNY